MTTEADGVNQSIVLRASRTPVGKVLKRISSETKSTVEQDIEDSRLETRISTSTGQPVPVNIAVKNILAPIASEGGEATRHVIDSTLKDTTEEVDAVTDVRWNASVVEKDNVLSTILLPAVTSRKIAKLVIMLANFSASQVSCFESGYLPTCEVFVKGRSRGAVPYTVQGENWFGINGPWVGNAMNTYNQGQVSRWQISLSDAFELPNKGKFEVSVVLYYSVKENEDEKCKNVRIEFDAIPVKIRREK